LNYLKTKKQRFVFFVVFWFIFMFAGLTYINWEFALILFGSMITLSLVMGLMLKWVDKGI